MNNTYCCSDFHGNYELWTYIKNYCDDTDTIFFLGDAADRGPDGIKLMQELMIDKRVVYIRGNHEQFLIDYYHHPKDKKQLKYWMRQGGEPTKANFDKQTKQMRALMIEYLEATPYYLCYKNKKGNIIYLSHAGFSPLKKEVDACDLLWDRKHLKESRWYGDDNTYIIHGHTPVFYLQETPRVEKEIYCNGHKIDIDLGTVTTHAAVLLNLDTFTDTLFYTGDALV